MVMTNLSHPFQGSNLFISARSPFARRVRLALREHGVAFRETVVDLFGPETDELRELARLSPVSRVPVLHLASGDVIADSTQILHAFYNGTVSAWMPTGEREAFRAHHFTGLALGLCDKTVERVIDRMRAAPDPELELEFRQVRDRTLEYLERELEGREWIAGGSHPTQADLDLGTALSYLCLRDSREWGRAHPRCAELLRKLEARPSFLQTQPPPAK